MNGGDNVLVQPNVNARSVTGDVNPGGHQPVSMARQGNVQDNAEPIVLDAVDKNATVTNVNHDNLSMNDLMAKVGIQSQPEQMMSDSGFVSDMSAKQILATILSDSKPRKIVSAGLNLGENLPHKLKQDIWADKYIDMAEIYFARDFASFSLSMDNPASADSHTVQFSAVKKQKQIRNINQWSKAWDTYVAVYIKKPAFMKHIGDLYTYSHHIKSMAEDGYNWLQYDRVFREDRAGMADPYPWNSYREDLFLKAASTVFKQANNNNSNSQINQQSKKNAPVKELIPKGFCYAFHSPTQRCSKNHDCSYSHDCFKCKKGKHPAFKCNASSASGKQRADKHKPNTDSNAN